MSHSLINPSPHPEAKTPSPQKTMALTTPNIEMRLTTDAVPLAGGDIIPAWGKFDFHKLTSEDDEGSQSNAEVYKCGVHDDIAGKD